MAKRNSRHKTSEASRAAERKRVRLNALRAAGLPTLAAEHVVAFPASEPAFLRAMRREAMEEAGGYAVELRDGAFTVVEVDAGGRRWVVWRGPAER